jgi:hypothetical protein
MRSENLKKNKYLVTVIGTGEQKTFPSIKKASEFIKNWCYNNDHSCGELDIDTKTLLWNVGTFKNPIVQFEKLTSFESIKN